MFLNLSLRRCVAHLRSFVWFLAAILSETKNTHKYTPISNSKIHPYVRIRYTH
ncbi:uncharacterized protein DS421_12g364860 [Arachis hypogaea]|nr:uncharacterized protein DS421_12g364860 [Arachis hypogaea]